MVVSPFSDGIEVIFRPVTDATSSRHAPRQTRSQRKGLLWRMSKRPQHTRTRRSNELFPNRSPPNTLSFLNHLKSTSCELSAPKQHPFHQEKHPPGEPRQHRKLNQKPSSLRSGPKAKRKIKIHRPHCYRPLVKGPLGCSICLPSSAMRYTATFLLQQTRSSPFLILGLMLRSQPCLQ
jgi:hypothetical protein